MARLGFVVRLRCFAAAARPCFLVAWDCCRCVCFRRPPVFFLAVRVCLLCLLAGAMMFWKKNKNNFIRTNTVCSCCVSRTKVGLPPRAQCSRKTIQEGIKAFEKMFYFLCPVFLSRFNTFFQRSFVAEYFIWTSAPCFLRSQTHKGRFKTFSMSGFMFRGLNSSLFTDEGNTSAGNPR